MDLKQTYDKIAEDWHNDHLHDDWWHKNIDSFISFLAPGVHILDVGCGAGHKSKYLTEKGFKVTGVDFSEGLLDIARREVPEAQFILADMRDLSSIDGQFDAVLAIASLLHIPKKEACDVMAGWVEKLKPGGHFCVIVKGTKEGKPEEGVIEENDYGYTYERFFSFYSPQEIRDHFITLGLHIEHEEEKLVGSTTWVQVVGKK